MVHVGTRPRAALPAAIGVVALLLASCVTGATTAPAPPSGPPLTASMVPTSATPTEAGPTRAPEAILGAFDVGGKGWSMTKAGDALWIQVDPPIDAIVRVDATTGATMTVAPAGRKAKSGPEGLWVQTATFLARLDPESGAETLRVPIEGQAQFALAEGSAWLLDGEELHRIDAETGAIADSIATAASAECADHKELAVAFESAWLACAEGFVIRIDLETGDTTAITADWGAHTFAITPDAVWVTNYEQGTVSRIEPETNEVTTVEDAGWGVGITTGGGYVWAAAERGIAKIDPESRAIVGTVHLGYGQYYELVWDEGVIWASTRQSKILKVDPTKLEP